MQTVLPSEIIPIILKEMETKDAKSFLEAIHYTREYTNVSFFNWLINEVFVQLLKYININNAIIVDNDAAEAGLYIDFHVFLKNEEKAEEKAEETIFRVNLIFQPMPVLDLKNYKIFKDHTVVRIVNIVVGWNMSESDSVMKEMLKEVTTKLNGSLPSKTTIANFVPTNLKFKVGIFVDDRDGHDTRYAIFNELYKKDLTTK